MLFSHSKQQVFFIVYYTVLDISFTHNKLFFFSGWKRLEELSSLLSPAYLRLGGTMADEVIFRVNGTESLSKDNNKYCTDDISKENFHIITGKFTKYYDFTRKIYL